MCGSLSTRNVEKVFTPHIIIQYLYISLHISTYLYIRVHDNRAVFVDVLLVGTSSRHLSRMIPGMATEYWPRLICLERLDLIRSLWSKYWYSNYTYSILYCSYTSYANNWKCLCPCHLHPPAMFGLNTSIVCCAMISQASLVVYPWSSIFWEGRSDCRR